MQAEPHQPADAAVEAQPARELGDGLVAADRRHRTLVVVVERFGRAAFDQRHDLGGGVEAALDRRLRDLRQRALVLGRRGGDVADREHLGVARERQIGSHRDPPTAGERHAEQVADRAADDSRRPDRDCRRQSTAVGEHDRVGLDVIDADTSDQVHPATRERVFRLRRRLGMERAEHARRGLDERDRQPVEMELAEVLLQHAVDELAQPAGGLDARRSPADDDDREVGPRPPGGDLTAGVLERRQQPRAQPDRVVQRLERYRVLVDAGDTEAGRHRPGGDDEVVVVQGDLVIDGHDAAVEVDRRHRAEHEARRFRAAQDAAHRKADVAGIEPGRRHLVQQRLERVEVVRVDDRHVDRRMAQSLDDTQPTEPGPDHDDMRSGCHDTVPRHHPTRPTASSIRGRCHRGTRQTVERLASWDHDDGAVGLVMDGDPHAVELGQCLRPQHVGRRAVRHHAALVHQRQMIGVHPRQRQVVHRRHDGQPVIAAEAGDELERLLLMADVERARRFVEQQDRRLRGEGAGDHQPLLLAAAQLAQAAVGELPHVEPPEHIARHRPVVARLRPEVADERCPPEQHVLERGHVVGQQRILRHVGEQRRPPRPRAQRQRDTVDEHVAREVDEPDGGAQERRLAGAVGADQSEPSARRDRRAERLHDLALAVAHGDGRELERAHRATCRVRSRRMKNGAPKNAVTTPIGSSAGAVSVRPGMSTRIRNAAPNAAVSGSSLR